MVVRSEIVWALWLLLFLTLELSAFFGVAPWHTLSRTAWLDESRYPILRTILLGFLIGLGVHVRWQTGLLRTTIGGILIACVLNYLWAA